MTDPRRARHRLVALSLLYVILIAGAGVFLARDLGARARIVGTDFTAFYTGWSLIQSGDGARLYEPKVQAAAQQRIIQPYVFPGGLLAFLNPPHVAIAFAPLARLDLVWAFRLWTALQLGIAALLAWGVIRRVRPPDGLSRLVVGLAVISFPPLTYALQLGQFSLLIALALLRLWSALEDDASGRAAVWLVVLAIKPQLCPLLVVFLAAHRRWRPLALAAALGAAVVAVSSALAGWHVWPNYVVALPRLEAFFAQGTAGYMVTLRGLVALAVGGREASAQTAAVLGTFIAAGAWLAVAWQKDPRPPPEVLARRFSLTVVLTLVLSPHLFFQDVTLWIAPLAISRAAFEDDPVRSLTLTRVALAWPLGFALVSAFMSATGRSPTLLSLPLIAVAIVAMTGRLAAWAKEPHTS